MMFATFALVILDPAKNEITFVDAGHPPAIRRRGNEVSDCFDCDKKGTLIGLGTTTDFFTRTLTMEPGDSIVMYTDGVTEAKDGERRLFGTERLNAAIESATDTADGIQTAILNTVAEFQHEDSPRDDVSLIVIRRD